MDCCAWSRRLACPVLDQASLTSFVRQQVVATKYELLRLVGVGGMGEVWEARHLLLGAPVAIKFALERRVREPLHLERFRREACALARLSSPDIVRVFDTGEHDHCPYLVMELLEGESLKTRLERETLLSLEAVGVLALQVARGLSVIHRAGMVHRDVTPGNLFLLAPTPEFPGVCAKILDFGIAKTGAGDVQITTSGALIGSPAYMSPEQARAEIVDAKSDLWSLAAVLYRCLTGQDAFGAPSVTEVLFRICTGELPSATKANPALPAELEGFFARAFARNRRFRFESASEMATAFLAIVDAHASPTLPNRQGPTERASNRARFRDGSTTSFVLSDGGFRGRRSRVLKYLAIVALSAGLGAASSLYVIGHADSAVDPSSMPSGVALALQPPEPARLVLAPLDATVPSNRLATATTPVASPAAASTRRRAPTQRAAVMASAPLARDRPTTIDTDATAKVDPIFGLPVKRTEHAETSRAGAVPGNNTSLP